MGSQLKSITMQNTGMKSETALLGGSFNPVHIGHLNLIHDAYALASMDKIVLIPALISNFKQGSQPLDFDVRLHLLELAVLDYRQMFPSDDVDIEISDVEMKRGGISYTSDTVRYFLSLYGVEMSGSYASCAMGRSVRLMVLISFSSITIRSSLPVPM